MYTLYDEMDDSSLYKKQENTRVPFYHHNLIDKYNNQMGRVDVGDLLQNYYLFEHFMSKWK